MKRWICAVLLSLAPWAGASDSDPAAVVAPLFAARDAFYEDVNKFRAGSLTEAQLVERISDQFAPLLDDRKVALRVMGRFARQASEDARVMFTERLESSLVDAYARGLAGVWWRRVGTARDGHHPQTGPCHGRSTPRESG